jgi:hypothetical protein
MIDGESSVGIARTNERYEPCEVCGGRIDTFDAGYYKSPDETFRHEFCHENGEPPEGYVFELTDTEHACTNRQYNCGHIVYAPTLEQPEFCPECNPLVYEDGEWSVTEGGR